MGGHNIVHVFGLSIAQKTVSQVCESKILNEKILEVLQIIILITVQFSITS